MNIKVWHCYWYGKYDTIIMLAETEDALRAKVREAIADGWYPDQGPMPEDFDELMERYSEENGDNCYFGGWGYEVLDSTLCGDEA
mgnify:CR=1 FL=1